MVTEPGARTPEDFERYFAGLLEEAATALLATLDAALLPSETSVEGNPIHSAGVVGFVGPEVRGSISVARTKVADASALEEDRLSELANQLAGRIKNMLGRVGVDYQVAPPVLLRGKQLSIASRERETRLNFSSPTTGYSVVAALEVLQPVELRPVNEEDLPWDEGQMLLF